MITAVKDANRIGDPTVHNFSLVYSGWGRGGPGAEVGGVQIHFDDAPMIQQL